MRKIFNEFDELMYSIIQPNIDLIILVISIVLIVLIMFKTKPYHYPGIFKDLPDEY